MSAFAWALTYIGAATVSYLCYRDWETKTQKTGLFEGGGYRTKGIYRPSYDCRMRTNNAPGFCTVCEKAVEKMIIFLTEE